MRVGGGVSLEVVGWLLRLELVDWTRLSSRGAAGEGVLAPKKVSIGGCGGSFGRT